MKKLSKREIEKQEKEKQIINCAEDLFCTKGYESASMNELAEKCGYTKRTIYKYFTCKGDIYYAVLFRSYTKLLYLINKKIDNTQTGFEKIYSLYFSFNKISNNNSNIIKIMSMGHNLKMKDDTVSMPYKEKFQNINKDLFTKIYELFKEGQSDGSITDKYDSSKLALASVFSMTGFYLMLSSSGEPFAKAFNLDIKDFTDFSLNLLTSSFKNN